MINYIENISSSNQIVNSKMRWTNFHGQKNLLNLEINHGSEKSKREPPQV